MELSEKVDRVVNRTQAFLEVCEPGHYLVKVGFPVATPVVDPLNSFDLRHELERYLDQLLNASRPIWEATAGLDDDSLPALCPRFGIAEHSAWIGQQVRLQINTCRATPLISNAAELSQLQLSSETEWFRYMQAGYAYLRSRQADDFILSVRGLMTPMEFANAVRGDQIFQDFLLDPGFAHQQMFFAVESLRWWYQQLLAWSDEARGGRVFALGGIWLGPDPVGHLSNDTAALCSEAV